MPQRLAWTSAAHPIHHPLGLVLLAVVLAFSAFASWLPAGAQAAPLPVTATAETDPVHSSGDAADDAAVWINPTDRSLSTIIGTDKTATGGLGVYDLAGKELHFYADGLLNNVDVHYNFPLGAQKIDLAAATNRTARTIDFYRANADRSLTRLGGAPVTAAIKTPRGICLYHSPVTGKYYAFVTDEGNTDQYELNGSSGSITATVVRQWKNTPTHTEGLVADDERGVVYLAVEDIGGIFRYGAEPTDSTTPVKVDGTTETGGHVIQDVKGLSMYFGRNGAGYLLAISQGGNSFHVYDRNYSGSAPNNWRGEFKIIDGNGIDAVTGMDGIDVTNVNAGVLFPSGFFVTQDTANPGGNQNFKVVPWQSIANAFSPTLTIDTLFDPRSIGGDGGNPPPPPDKPAAPAGLGATGGQRQVALSWGAAAGADSYNVYRSASPGGPFTKINASAVSGTSYTDSGLADGATWSYQVKGVNSAGEGGASNTATASTDAPSTTTCAPRSSSYSAAILGTAGLTGYWRLGEAANGATACASRGPDGAFSAAGVASATGAIAGDADTAAALNGSGFVSAANDAGFNGASALSLEGWVKPASVAGSQAVARKDGQYYVKIYDGRLQVWLWSGATTKSTITTASAVMTAGAWQHVALTYDGTTARIYRNGAQVASQALSVTIPTTANALHWGDAIIGGVEQNFLTGALDEVALYNQALTAGQVSGHYQAGLPAPTPPPAPGTPTATGGQGQIALSWGASAGATSYNIYRSQTTSFPATPYRSGITGTSFTDSGLPASTTYNYQVAAVNGAGEGQHSTTATGATQAAPTGCAPLTSKYSTAVTSSSALVGYWRLGESSGTTACATRGPAGSYSGGVVLGAGGAIAADADTAAMLDGSGFVSVPSAAALNSARLSLEAWVRPSSSVAGSQTIVRKDGQYQVKIYDGKLQVWLWSGATTRVTITTAAAVMTVGAWQHVAVTYDGSTVRVYRNGAQVTSQALSVTIPSTANPVHWGDTLTGGVEQNFLNGALDEGALYNQALTATQVSQHYTTGTTG